MKRSKTGCGTVALGIVLVHVSRVSQAGQGDYERGLSRLQSNQVKIDQALRNMGVGSERSSESPGTSADPERVSHLFQIHSSLSQSRLSTGQLLFGKTVNRLIVGADGSPVLVELDEAQGSLSGLRVMGVARQAGTPGRLSIELQRLLNRGGRAVAIQATGLDTDGGFGLAAQVLSGKALATVGAIASGFLSGVASSQQTQNTNAFGFSQVQPTGRNAVLQGLAQSTADQSKRLIDEATAEKPVLVIEALTPVTVLIQEEVHW